MCVCVCVCVCVYANINLSVNFKMCRSLVTTQQCIYLKYLPVH